MSQDVALRWSVRTLFSVGSNPEIITPTRYNTLHQSNYLGEYVQKMMSFIPNHPVVSKIDTSENRQILVQNPYLKICVLSL